MLEDINLQGARGILVNICAADMGIAEFDEVGNIVHAFASDEALIKIGTAIDESLGDDIKVTVVATGMGSAQKVANAPIKMTATNAAATDYSGLETPAVSRKNVDTKETRFGVQPKNNADMDYLDIPAFLRRQAD